MYIRTEQLAHMQDRVERRVRGNVLYWLHIGIAILYIGWTIVSQAMSVLNGVSIYASVVPILLAFLFFAVTLGIHTFVRWLNHIVEQSRQRGMEHELQRVWYRNQMERHKRKSGDFLLDRDGEVIYVEDDVEPKRKYDAANLN